MVSVYYVGAILGCSSVVVSKTNMHGSLQSLWAASSLFQGVPCRLVRSTAIWPSMLVSCGHCHWFHEFGRHLIYPFIFFHAVCANHTYRSSSLGSLNWPKLIIEGSAFALVSCANYIDIVIAYWLEFGLRNHKTSFRWRFPLAFQVILTIVLLLTVASCSQNLPAGSFRQSVMTRPSRSLLRFVPISVLIIQS